MCLLDALFAVVPRSGRRLIVGHIDHGLRRESGEDAEYVRRCAERYRLRCEVRRVDVAALAATASLGVEEAARVGRYRALRDLAAEVGTDVVATGHTRDDSVETVLMHLLRGSGRRGLAGIAEDERLGGEMIGKPRTAGAEPSIRLVRPLLELERAETTAYCEARGITWRSDRTNDDPRMLRNRVRGHLLPVLRTYHPAVDRSVARLASTLRDEETWISQIETRLIRRLVRILDGSPAIDLVAWRRQPTAVQRRIVRRIATSAGHTEIGFEAVERALAVGSEHGPPRAELGGGLRVERRSGVMVFDPSGRGSDERG
jgi:tRNA(Ile)-lysidine synthase